MLYSSWKARVGSTRQSISSSSLVKRPYAIRLSFSYTIPDEKHQKLSKTFFCSQKLETATSHPNMPSNAGPQLDIHQLPPLQWQPTELVTVLQRKPISWVPEKRVLFNVFTLINYDRAYDFTLISLCIGVYICVFFPDHVSIVKPTTVISICSMLCHLGPCVPSSARCQ